MSWAATDWAHSQRCGGPGPKLVLLALSDHHNRESDQCNPRIKTLAWDCEMSESSVKAHLAKLRDLGLIEWIPTVREDGSAGPNRYRLLRQGVGQNLTHLGQGSTEGGSDSDPGVGQNLATKNQEVRTRKRTPSSADADDEFEAFWKVYPRRVAKPAARKAWARAVKTETPARIIEGAARCARQAAAERTEAKYIPNPATWLNNERWADEATPAPVDRAAATAARMWGMDPDAVVVDPAEAMWGPQAVTS